MLQRLSLRLLLTLPYIGLLVLLAATVGWLSYQSADDAIDTMAAKLHTSSGERIQEATAAYLTNWQYVVAAATAPEPLSGPVLLAPIERALWLASGLSSVRPSYVFFASPDGRFVGVQRAGDQSLLKLRDEAGASPRRLYRVHRPADRQQLIGQEEQAFVAQSRPWYAKAAASDKEVWSSAYLDFSTQQPMITLTLAQRSTAGDLIGVYGADVPLAQIGSFLRNLEIAKQGLAYIVSSDGRLIGSSLPEGSSGTSGHLPQASASTNPLLQASFRAIDNLPSGTGRAALIDSAQGRMLVSVSPLRHQAGLDWRIVVVLPHSLLTAGIERNAVRTAFLAGLASLMAMTIGLLTLRSLAGEIGALTRAAEQLSSERAPAPLQSRRRDELGRLSDAFDRMVGRLRSESMARDSAEQELRGVTDTMSEGFIVVDRQWRVGYANRLTLQLAGRSLDDVLGKPVWDAFPTLPGTELETALRGAADSGQPRILETWREQVGRWVEVRMFPSPQGIAVFFTDVTQRHLASAALAERQQQLQTLAGELLSAQSEERRAIARELHDEFGQQLAALRINLEVVLRAQARGAAATEAARLDDSLQIVQHVIRLMRDRALDLHPAILDDLGLVAALHWMAERKAERSGLAIRVHERGTLPPLPPQVGLAFFRIAQEAMLNAIKHAHAQHIDLTIGVADGRLAMTIHNDGTHFEAPGPGAARQSLGLLSMRERTQQLGGTFSVRSQQNLGTTVEVSIPLPSE